jgi:hypothetical protein
VQKETGLMNGKKMGNKAKYGKKTNTEKKNARR